MVSIEPVCEVCRKALHLKVKIQIDITAACPKRFGLTVILTGLVFIGKNIHHFHYIPLEPY